MSNYHPNGHKRSANDSVEDNRDSSCYPDIDSHGGSIGRSTGLPRNTSIDELHHAHTTAPSSHSLFKNKNNSNKQVNPPAIMTTSTGYQSSKGVGNQKDAQVNPFTLHAQAAQASQSSLTSTKATLLKMAVV